MKDSCAPIYSREKILDIRSNAFSNVIDEYKNLSTNEIRSELKKKQLNYAICMQNFIGDFNISTVWRCSNAFSVKELFYLGLNKIDKRGCCGVQNYTDITYLETEESFIALKNKYKFVAVDNSLESSISIDDYVPEEGCMFVFGSEGEGLLPSIANACEQSIYIPQFGSIRSINVGCAAAIVMQKVSSSLRKAI